VPLVLLDLLDPLVEQALKELLVLLDPLEKQIQRQTLALALGLSVGKLDQI
jgi:hypothetical protein